MPTHARVSLPPASSQRYLVKLRRRRGGISSKLPACKRSPLASRILSATIRCQILREQRYIRAGALPIESVELSRTGQLWGLNMLLTFRAGVTEWFWQRAKWAMRGSGVGAVGPGVTFSSDFAEENSWRARNRSRLSEGSQSTIR
jgi:hypothetical protein